MTLIVRALRPVAHWLRRQPRLVGPLRRLVRSHPLLVRFGTWLIYSPLPVSAGDRRATDRVAPISAELGAAGERGRLEVDVLLSRIRAERDAHEDGRR